MARVAWTAAARSDFELIIRRIGRRSVRGAERWGEKVRASLGMLELFPEIGSPVEDSRHPGLREQIVDSYRVVYRYNGSECRVLGIVHAKADLDRVLGLDDPT